MLTNLIDRLWFLAILLSHVFLGPVFQRLISFVMSLSHTAMNQNTASLLSSLLSQTFPTLNPSTQNTTFQPYHLFIINLIEPNTFLLVYLARAFSSKLYQSYPMTHTISGVEIGKQYVRERRLHWQPLW